MVDMRVQLLYVDGCSHRTILEERLREALDRLGHPSTIACVRGAARRRRNGWGSPDRRRSGSTGAIRSGRPPVPVA